MRDLEFKKPTVVVIRDNSRLIIEASRIFIFPLLPRVPCFSFFDRAVLVITTYGPRVTGGGTACGQLMKSGVNRGTTPG